MTDTCDNNSSHNNITQVRKMQGSWVLNIVSAYGGERKIKNLRTIVLGSGLFIHEISWIKLLKVVK